MEKTNMTRKTPNETMPNGNTELADEELSLVAGGSPSKPAPKPATKGTDLPEESITFIFGGISTTY